MNPKIEFENLKNELMSLGFTSEKLDQLLALAMEELIDIAINDLEQSEDDNALEQLTTLLETTPTNEQEAADRINKIFLTAYGENAEVNKFKLLNQYLKDTIKVTQDSKNLLERYAQGDPTAIAAIQANIEDPDAKRIDESLRNQITAKDDSF
ncbi:hypothetical protein KBB69_02980 [Candidatus Dojkabacteria bacterium]|jgi:ferritin|nr:hypothetical protein [Candidatus Dojkabacteria bacterium]HQA87705.1 hypothetical protein [Candidatus Dojkabacteria bacterium]